MTTQEFFKTTLFKILKRHQIKERLTAEEYYTLLKLVIDACAENELKNMGIGVFNDNDGWRYK